MRTTTQPAPEFHFERREADEGLDARLLRIVAAQVKPAAVRFALGSASARASAEPPLATIRIRDRRTLLAMLIDPARRFGDLYADGRVEVEGDLVAALRSVYRALESKPPSSLLGTLSRFVPHSPDRDRDNVHHHYDLGNDFYRLWLDERLVYTCAYFETPDRSLEQAQHAKMDLVCRKLGLREGETVIEAGCGWGTLALYMARRCGVRVRAFNIAKEQLLWARERAKREGLTDRVAFYERDYRDIDGHCDAFVSVGMLEHVGRANYRDLSQVIARTLDAKHGRGLLHFIGRDRAQPLDPWITRRIFPGAYAPTLDEAIAGVLAPAHMSVTDVENLRPHYALTLKHWRLRFERALAEGRVAFDERFRRMWKLYLAGSEASFETGWLQLFQVTFAPSGSNAVPWSRAPLYQSKRGLSWNDPTS
jgi:cyclopropane-fatty-acyl-phospholipid synthase